jgi:hypothetical protein
LQRLALRKISAAHHRKPNPQRLHLLLHQSWGYVICDRFCDIRHGFEIDCEANKIDGVQCDLGFWTDHDEANEISHAAICKYLLRSSRETERKVMRMSW